MNKIKGISLLAVGGVTWIIAIIAFVSWISFCFGTIVVGVLLLMLAPGVLVAPLGFIGGLGSVFLITGMEKLTEKTE